MIITGVWMGFAGSWWGRGWIWTAIVVLALVIASMVFVARPYYTARLAKDDAEVVQSSDPSLASVALEVVWHSNYGPARFREGPLQREAFINVKFTPAS